eukprot:353225-Chlamydomonas_euryale.AAC.2
MSPVTATLLFFACLYCVVPTEYLLTCACPTVLDASSSQIPARLACLHKAVSAAPYCEQCILQLKGGMIVFTSLERPLSPCALLNHLTLVQVSGFPMRGTWHVGRSHA